MCCADGADARCTAAGGRGGEDVDAAAMMRAIGHAGRYSRADRGVGERRS